MEKTPARLLQSQSALSFFCSLKFILPSPSLSMRPRTFFTWHQLHQVPPGSTGSTGSLLKHPGGEPLRLPWVQVLWWWVPGSWAVDSRWYQISVDSMVIWGDDGRNNRNKQPSYVTVCDVYKWSLVAENDSPAVYGNCWTWWITNGCLKHVTRLWSMMLHLINQWIWGPRNFRTIPFWHIFWCI